MRLTLALPFVLAFASACYCQESPRQVSTIELSQVETSLQLDSLMMMYFDTSWSTDFNNIPFDAYSPPPQKEGPHWWYSSYFHFVIHNDSKDVYNGAVYVAETGGNKVARVNTKGEITQLIEPASYGPFNEKYFSFSVPADSTWHLVIHAEDQVFYDHLAAWLVNASQFEMFMKAYTSDLINPIFLHSIIGGMVAMMLIYVLSQFSLIRTAEYGYYAAYIFLMLLFVAANGSEDLQIDSYNDFVRLYKRVNEHLQFIAYCLYFAFLSTYTKAKTSDPLLYRILRIAIITLVAYVVVDNFLFFVVGYKNLSIYLFTPFRCALILFVIFLAYRVWNLKQPYARYPIYGGLIFLAFATISLVCAFNWEWRTSVTWPFGYGMFWYFTGVLCEITFFTLGLAHKRRQDAIDKVEAQEALKLEVERQQVRHLNALSEVQENERSRFAKDLHDGLGGMLSGVKLSLSNMKGNVVLNGEHVDVFERALDMLDNSIHELRRVAHNLMPESLVKFGLAASLKDFCDFINSSKVIHVIFQQIGTYKQLEMSIEIVLYRIANELVNNALRHASATELIIQLNYDDNSLTLTVEDNGKGFEQGILTRTTGSGWPNIKSRVAYLKGTLDVQTSPGNGTSVNITIPL